MLRSLTVLFLAVSTAIAVSLPAGEPDNRDAPVHLRVGDSEIPLRGTGMRRKFGMRLYEASLFTGEATADGIALLASDGPIAVRIDVRSPLFTKPRMRRMVSDAIGEVSQEVRAGLDRMFDAIDEDVDRGDVVEFAYEPERGTALRLNGEHKTTVAGTEFRRALFGVWIGGRAVDAKLAESLLPVREP